jgi:hypothetical protein
LELSPGLLGLHSDAAPHEASEWVLKPSRSQVEVHKLNPWGGDMEIEAPKGTSMKPDAGMMFHHIGGYDGWFEKAVLCGRMDGRIPIKSATFTAFRGMHMVHGKCSLRLRSKLSAL